MSKLERRNLLAQHDGEIAMLRQHCGIPRPADAAIAARKAATLAVGDTVEVTDRARLADNTICSASPTLGAVGTIEAITTAVNGKPYKVRFSMGSPDYFYYPAASLRRVPPAADDSPDHGLSSDQLRAQLADLTTPVLPAHAPAPPSRAQQIETALTALMDRARDERLLAYYDTIMAAAAVQPDATAAAVHDAILQALTQGGK